MKQLESYTYTVPAGGSVQIPAANDNFYVTASTGRLSVRGDTFGRLRGIVAGQGLKGVPFNRLELIDESGAPNTVTILLTPAEFVNQVFSGSVAIVGDLALNTATVNSLTRPQLAGVTSNNSGTMAANVPATMLLPSANVNGLILHSAHAVDYNPTQFVLSLIAKNAAPTTIIDGAVLAIGQNNVTNGTCSSFIEVDRDILVPAGLGLYYIMNLAGTAGMARTVRYTLL